MIDDAQVRGKAPEETWTLSYETPEGVTRSARQVFVARGERRSLDLRGTAESGGSKRSLRTERQACC